MCGVLWLWPDLSSNLEETRHTLAQQHQASYNQRLVCFRAACILVYFVRGSPWPCDCIRPTLMMYGRASAIIMDRVRLCAVIAECVRLSGQRLTIGVTSTFNH